MDRGGGGTDRGGGGTDRGGGGTDRGGGGTDRGGIFFLPTSEKIHAGFIGLSLGLSLSLFKFIMFRLKN